MLSTEYVLWGWSARLGVNLPVRITSAQHPQELRQRQKQFHTDYADALTAIYKRGVDPKGLRAQVQERTS